jgi:RimJ/RimL family protein N-acetyltransferase
LSRAGERAGGGVKVRGFAGAAEFLERAGPYLAAREAEHNLLLGLGAGIAAHPEKWPDPYLATVEEDGAVVGAAVMPPLFNLVLSLLAGPEAATAALAADLRRRYPTLPGVLGPPAESRAFLAAWARESGQTATLSRAELIYRAERIVAPPHPAAGALRRATEADRGLLLAWVGDFFAESLGEERRDEVARMVENRLTTTTGGFYLWEDGGPVSLVGWSGPTPNGVRIGPVYTPPEHRRRGYAATATAELGWLLLAEGRRFVFLFTAVANPTSNRIYRAIGFEPVCEVDEYRFLPLG